MHCRIRHFDPERQRSGLSNHVAALVERVEPDGVELVLVNTDPAAPHAALLQAGAFGEHAFETVTLDGNTHEVHAPHLTVQLGRGAVARLRLRMSLFVRPPSYRWPWEDGWPARHDAGR
jgi:hypothetical protein